MTPYTARCEKFGGGVVSLSLIEAEGLLSAIFNYRTNVFTELQCRPGYKFATITLPEDSCTYTQTTITVNGTIAYEHKIVISLRGMEPESRLLAEQLSQKGVAAIIKTHSEELLVGYCLPQRCVVPLRLDSAVASSAQKLSQSSSQTITLTCKEPFGAKPYKPL